MPSLVDQMPKFEDLLSNTSPSWQNHLKPLEKARKRIDHLVFVRNASSHVISPSHPPWFELTNWVTKRDPLINQLILNLNGGYLFREVSF
jgi:hypothetical protein